MDRYTGVSPQMSGRLDVRDCENSELCRLYLTDCLARAALNCPGKLPGLSVWLHTGGTFPQEHAIDGLEEVK